MPYPLRMPKELRDRLEFARNKNGRSLNAEILLRLEQSLEGFSVEGVGPQSEIAIADKLEEMRLALSAIKAVYDKASSSIEKRKSKESEDALFRSTPTNED